MKLGNAVQITREWEKPIMTRERLGSIPNDYYESVWNPLPYYGSDFSSSTDHYCHGTACEMGGTPVYRDKPVYDASGNPRKQKVTSTLSETPYDQNKSTWISGSVGGALGAATGAGVLALIGGASPASLLVSGLAGAALGAGAGAFIGSKSTAKDEIVEVWERESIVDPKLVGYRHEIDPDVQHTQQCHLVPDGNGGQKQDCSSVPYLRGYDHDYYPLLENKVVGEYTYPTLQHTNKMGPGTGGLLAGLAGAGIGAAVAAAVHFI